MGHYVDNNLIKDEQVELETTYHWIIFISLRALFTLFIAPMIDRYTDEFAITNKRVIIKTGLISRKTFEMNHSKIESVNVDQSIMGRILGYGTIGIVGSGGTREVFPNIKNPLAFRKKFQEMSF
ncbi:PH domain-containing protein [Flavobacterium sp.]|uniref:PH domain-containing protein n=1 Tax=Flavobacterium sp. TaxID=239 RepID=UPI00262D24A3|nr:PH domain-containing protein [Flavobacterium sp.]MDD2986491.1 PH domain-containing protein [Flavobacterium sp.]